MSGTKIHIEEFEYKYEVTLHMAPSIGRTQFKCNKCTVLNMV